MANISSVNLLLEARARFRISIVASSDIESASANLVAYSDSVLAWYPSTEISKTALKCDGIRFFLPVAPHQNRRQYQLLAHHYH